MIDLVGTLKEEIAKGELCLKADELFRCRFYFEIDGYPIGCYALRSTAPFEVRAERAWNISRYSWDIEKKLFVPATPRRHFGRVRAESKVVIRELTPRGDITLDRVCFSFQTFAIFDGSEKRDEGGKVFKFEVADLQGVKFLDG